MATMEILNSIIGSLVTALVLFLGWSFTLGRKFQVIDDLKTGFIELKEDFGKLRGEFKALEMKVQKDIFELEMRIQKDIRALEIRVQGDIKQLVGRVSALEGSMRKSTQSQSPLSPTALGIKYITESGLIAVLNNRAKKEILFEAMRRELPKDYMEYDVQEASRWVLNKFMEHDPAMRAIKEYAFQQGISIWLIIDTGSLWLRDDFLGIPRKIIADKKAEEITKMA